MSEQTQRRPAAIISVGVADKGKALAEAIST
jgi:hypothetical protein